MVRERLPLIGLASAWGGECSCPGMGMCPGAPTAGPRAECQKEPRTRPPRRRGSCLISRFDRSRLLRETSAERS